MTRYFTDAAAVLDGARPGASAIYAPPKSAGGGRGVSFPGFHGPNLATHAQLTPRGVAHLALDPGALLRLDLSRARFAVWAAAFDERGCEALDAIGCEAGALTARPAPLDRVDAARFRAWRAAHGAVDATPRALALPPAPRAEPLILRARRRCDLWLMAPIEPDALIAGASGGEALVSVERPSGAERPLPPALGPVREAFTVARATARAYRVAKAEVVQVIDVEGRQCSDFMAFRLSALDQGLERMIDGTVTRTLVKGGYPTPGLFDRFYDADMRPLLALVQDTVGRHDTFALACTALGYEERGFPGHLNCSDNMSEALSPFGVAPRRAWPAVNFFFNAWVDPVDGRLRADEGWSRPGDYVALRALDDLLCVSTACPDDIDPINGWNPTDIHVRIYRANAPIPRAVAFRAKEDALPVLSEPSAFAPRTGALTRHVAPARDLWLPVSYASTGALEEYWACREAATVQDMSALRKFDLRGPDAAALLQRATTRDIERLGVHRGVYALICDETGAVIDDGALFRLAPDLFRWCCGSEESGRALSALAAAEGFRVRVDALHGAMPSLAVQGPKSREALRSIVFTKPQHPSLDALKWFGCTVARIGAETGPPAMVTRTGFTGELGYEIFCDKSDAVAVWDAVLRAGAPHGLVPMGSEALELLRVEAGLMSAGAEFGGEVDAVEAGLGFAISRDKPDFVGRAALERALAAPRRKLVGLRLETDEPPARGDPVLIGERPIGRVTSAVRSPMLRCAIAMARVAVDCAALGATVQVGRLDGRMKRCAGKIVDLPFVDPQRARARA